jgi:ribosomal protein S18 acetylase RimI-like enzyme
MPLSGGLMQFLPLTNTDWQLFLKWAATEDWTISSQELRLFQNQWRHCFFVLHAEGKVTGFVSAVAYEESGWIGNLLVGSEHRGRGYGAALFDFALALLRQAGLQRIWLTASEAGLPIYQRRGFVTVDRVDRWYGRGQGLLELSQQVAMAELIDLDRSCWGESRAALLSLLANQAEICGSDKNMALLQPSASGWQLGPWLAPPQCSQHNRLTLQEALGKTPAGTGLLTDVLASANMEACLHIAGFNKSGSNLLMCLSSQTPCLQGVAALASLGSIG